MFCYEHCLPYFRSCTRRWRVPAGTRWTVSTPRSLYHPSSTTCHGLVIVSSSALSSFITHHWDGEVTSQNESSACCPESSGHWYPGNIKMLAVGRSHDQSHDRHQVTWPGDAFVILQLDNCQCLHFWKSFIFAIKQTFVCLKCVISVTFPDWFWDIAILKLPLIWHSFNISVNYSTIAGAFILYNIGFINYQR